MSSGQRRELALMEGVERTAQLLSPQCQCNSDDGELLLAADVSFFLCLLFTTAMISPLFCFCNPPEVICILLDCHFYFFLQHVCFLFFLLLLTSRGLFCLVLAAIVTVVSQNISSWQSEPLQRITKTEQEHIADFKIGAQVLISSLLCNVIANSLNNTVRVAHAHANLPHSLRKHPSICSR